MLAAPSSLAADRVTVSGLRPAVQKQAVAIVHRLSTSYLAGNYTIRLVSDPDGLTATYRAALGGRQDPDLGVRALRTPMFDGRRLILGDGAGQATVHLNALINSLINEGAAGVYQAAQRKFTYQLALEKGAEQLVFKLCTDFHKCALEPYAPVMYFGPSAPGGAMVGQNYDDGFRATLDASDGNWNPQALKAAYTLLGLSARF